MEVNKLPDENGYFGRYGGRFLPETLMSAVIELEEVYDLMKKDTNFQEEFHHYLCQYAGRPTPLYHARRLGEYYGIPGLYLKREDLCHTGAHKINNALGQALLATRMGKKRVIAETGAGQHGVAVATTAALLGLECTIFMGAEDIRRQRPNVFRMRLLGAHVREVESGDKTLKEATNEALREWIATIDSTHYIIGSVVGPHPFPRIVRDFQSVIGQEVKEQIKEREGRLPDHILACVGGGSNAIGIFASFIPHREVTLTGIEAGGEGSQRGQHSSTLLRGNPGVFHGNLSYLLQDVDGQIMPVHSISAGLDYPGVGPEHSFLKDSGRAQYVSVSDKEALEAFMTMGQKEGILPAMESSHAIAYLPYLAESLRARGESKNSIVIINLSGRGDKDLDMVNSYLENSNSEGVKSEEKDLGEGDN